MNERKLLFLVTEDGFFVSHRLPLGRAAVDAGYEVVVATRCSGAAARIRGAGIRVVDIALDRRGVNPFVQLASMLRLWRLYRRERPTIVHHVALKPVILGGVAARLARVPSVVGAVTGLGYLFTDGGRLPLVRALVTRLFRHCFDLAIVQNDTDRDALVRAGVPTGRVRIVPGAGVDLAEFQVRPEPVTDVPIVVMPARLLRDKGVLEFVEAARISRGRGIKARFALVGGVDSGNPSAVPESDVRRWVEDGVVEWWGHRADMPEVFGLANLVCLPSYREGLPKVLIEAAACGRAAVTTDVPGCRDAVVPGETATVVPSRDADALADALGELIRDPGSRARMGAAGRRMVEDRFSTECVNPRILAIYDELEAGAK